VQESYAIAARKQCLQQAGVGDDGPLVVRALGASVAAGSGLAPCLALLAAVTRHRLPGILAALRLGGLLRQGHRIGLLGRGAHDQRPRADHFRLAAHLGGGHVPRQHLHSHDEQQGGDRGAQDAAPQIAELSSDIQARLVGDAGGITRRAEVRSDESRRRPMTLDRAGQRSRGGGALCHRRAG